MESKNGEASMSMWLRTQNSMPSALHKTISASGELKGEGARCEGGGVICIVKGYESLDYGSVNEG